LKKKQRRETIGPQWLRWIMFTGGALCMGFAIAMAVLWINFDSIAAVRVWAEKYTMYIPLTTLLYATAVYVLGAVIGKLWLSGAIVGVAALILALIDYFKTAINGTPLSVADFGLATQLGDVAGIAGDLTPPVDFWKALIVLLICAALLFLFRKLTILKGRTRFLSASISLMVLIALFSPNCAETIGRTFDVDVYARMPAANNTATHGMTIALWRDCVLRPADKPEEYSEAYMEDVLQRIDALLAERGESQGEATQPNVIFILSEAFFDLNRLPDLQYGSDPLANFHALAEEGISGNFYSNYLGYGTGYIEMAMHYGVNNQDFGPSTNLCFMEDKVYEYLDSMVEQYTNSGDYRAEMLHAFDNSLYNRTVTYPMMGYSDLHFSADVQNLGFAWDEGVYGGYYLRDAYLFAGMLDRMEKINAEGKRAFLYGITMENHQPFDPGKFYYECQIDVESSVLSEENMAIVRVMLEGITRADQALGALTDALRESDEPTVVVFYGDHRPNLFMTDGETVYTKLDICPSNEMSEWTPEQVAELYSTDYLIWANDAALMQGKSGTKQDSSISAIGPQLLELTNQPVSRYWALQQLVSEAALADVDLYFADGESTITRNVEDAALTEAQRELLELRRAVVYDTYFGEQYITQEMNALTIS